MDHLIMLNVTWVARRDKATEKYQLTLQFPLVLWSFLASFSRLFWFYGLTDTSLTWVSLY